MQTMSEESIQAIVGRVRKSDCRREYFRGSGPGGQHRNKVETCVRFTHVATGIVAEGKRERSRSANEAEAWRLLLAKLADLYRSLEASRMHRAYLNRIVAAFGSERRRTYYLAVGDSITMDHRTGYRAPTAEVLCRGKLDPFIAAQLRHGLPTQKANG